MADLNPVLVPSLGHNVVLVDREQLRTTRHGRMFYVPNDLKAIARKLPVVPPTFDWSKGEMLKFPILGNDRYGDCYYAAACHGSQCYTGNAGTECGFDVNAVIKRYLKLSGGDNGLGDQDMMPEWESGIVGPNGPQKIIHEMTVNVNDDDATALSMWAFCGLIFTASLPDHWINIAGPGAVWDVATPNPRNGHAMYLTGRNSHGYYDLRTWGISPPVQLTPAGLKSADPELIVAFSRDMFNSQGIAPNGMTYDALATLWQQCGGRPVPPWDPTPLPPVPPVPPIPPPKPPWCHGLFGDMEEGRLPCRKLARATFAFFREGLAAATNELK